MHALSRPNYGPVPGAQWLKPLLAHVSDKHKHMIRCYPYYRSRQRDERRRRHAHSDTVRLCTIADEPTVSQATMASWARLYPGNSTRPIRLSGVAVHRCASSAPVACLFPAAIALLW